LGFLVARLALLIVGLAIGFRLHDERRRGGCRTGAKRTKELPTPDCRFICHSHRRVLPLFARLLVLAARTASRSFISVGRSRSDSGQRTALATSITASTVSARAAGAFDKPDADNWCARS